MAEGQLLKMLWLYIRLPPSSITSLPADPAPSTHANAASAQISNLRLPLRICLWETVNGGE